MRKLYLLGILALGPAMSYADNPVDISQLTPGQQQAEGRRLMMNIHNEIRAKDWTDAAADCRRAMVFKNALTPDECIQLGRDETVIIFQALGGGGGGQVYIPPAGATAPPTADATPPAGSGINAGNPLSTAAPAPASPPPAAGPTAVAPVMPAASPSAPVVAVAPTTPAPVTPAPVTPAPVTPAPVTPAPVTPALVTPAPVTPAVVTPAVATPAVVTPAVVTPAGTTPPALPVSTPADAEAAGLMAKLQAAVTAKDWVSVGHLNQQLEGLLKEGFQKTRVSPPMHPYVADAVHTAQALNTLSRLPAPGGPGQFLNRARLELDAHLLDAAEADLAKVATFPKLPKEMAEEFHNEKVRDAKLRAALTPGIKPAGQ